MKSLHSVEPGEFVWRRDGSRWRPAIYLGDGPSPFPYPKSMAVKDHLGQTHVHYIVSSYVVSDVPHERERVNYENAGLKPMTPLEQLAAARTFDTARRRALLGALVVMLAGLLILYSRVT